MDAHHLDEVSKAIRPNTALVYLETLGNPNSDIPNVDAIAKIAHDNGLPWWSITRSARRICSVLLSTGRI